MKRLIFVALMAIFVAACQKEPTDAPQDSSQDNNRTIYYTSTDGNIVTPYKSDGFNGVKIVSNVYENGVGVITFSDDLTTIGLAAFGECKTLSSIKLPESVTTIKQSAFGLCENLTNIELPNSITEIGPYAFKRCTALETITLPSNLMVIDRGSQAGAEAASARCYPSRVS